MFEQVIVSAKGLRSWAAGATLHSLIIFHKYRPNPAYGNKLIVVKNDNDLDTSSYVCMVILLIT